MINERSAILNRMFVIFGLILLVPVAIVLQLIRIDFLKGDQLRKLWSDQALENISIPARRGNIYDEDGSLLATNSVAYKAAIDPHLHGVTDQQIQQVCDTLGKYSTYRSSHYRRKIQEASPRSRYVLLGKNIGVKAYEAVQSLHLQALILREEYQRYYSFGSMAAHTLGYVNHKMNGKTGLEKEYNTALKGTNGVQQVRRSRSGKIFAYVGAPRKKPENGYSLYTTLNSHIQAILEEELKAGVNRTQSHYGTAIVMDPSTGAIKAMANYPTFNPNNPASLTKKNRRNFMISDMIEPGSTFKLVTAIAAVEQHKVTFNEKITTPATGKLKIHGQWMRDHDPLGTMTFPRIIQESSNVGTSKIAMRLSKDTFYQYARNLGFGTPTNVDLPNEESGKLKKPYQWTPVSLPWMSIGYEVQVTPIQLAQAYAAFANHGKMMRPFLVKKVVNDNGKTIKRHPPAEVRQIAKKSTLNKLYPVFEGVVSDSGTAEKAKVKGLPIAGKTGTAQKLINGRYRHEYRGTFVGFFPAKQPKYLCLVMMDQPQTWPPYGGWVAGPVFRQTAKRIAGLDNAIEKQIIAHEQTDSVWAYTPHLYGMKKENVRALLQDLNIPVKFAGSGSWVESQQPKGGAILKHHKSVQVQLTSTSVQKDSTTATNYASIPDVGGMSMREAVRIIHSRGFKTRIIGSGTVFRQYPRPGDPMKHGRTVTVRGKEPSLNTLAVK